MRLLLALRRPRSDSKHLSPAPHLTEVKVGGADGYIQYIEIRIFEC
jgi:hypothetical protein